MSVFEVFLLTDLYGSLSIKKEGFSCCLLLLSSVLSVEAFVACDSNQHLRRSDVML